MRETSKMISIPVGEENLNFRISKLDAFSGARLLKLLSIFQEKAEEGKAFSLSDFLFSLSDADFASVMRLCLTHVEVQLPAGFIPAYRNDCWGMPDLEYETVACLKLTLEEIAWSLSGFFPGSGRSSPPGEETTSR